ncbi:hypothetical protein K5D44_22310 [Pseudomonas cichorii]|nr:hypothetical protein [Pseudomonas cichorii]MBX8555760.1 hypothetical protein [Pseudomonas cichorii]MBX8567442.1 hypothetical protein [Pseudomonas cichorii]
MAKPPSSTTAHSFMPVSGRLGVQAIVLLVVACMTLGILTGSLLYGQYKDVETTRRTELANLSASILRSAESSITYASMILVGLAERYRHDGETSENLARMMSVAHSRVDGQTEIQGIFFMLLTGDGS